MPTPAEDVALRAADGVSLAARLWSTADPRAVAVIAHGFGEHGGCHDGLARHLVADPGVDALAFDFRGHGRSAGKRGVVRRYDDLQLDLLAALDWAERTRPGLPLFVVGHSNGGLVALRTIADRGEPGPGVAGLIVTNPSLRLTAHVPPWKRIVGEALLRLAPGITLDAGISEGDLSRDPLAIEGYRADPLRHSRISPPFFFGMVRAGREALARPELIRVPLLLIIGGADPLVDPSASVGFFERIGAEDGTLSVHPSMRHELFHEVGREAVLAEAARWIGSRLT